MRRFMRYFKTAAVLAVLSSSLQGCYTYVPAMSRESDGVYYNASKDSDRAQRAQEYYAQNRNSYRSDDRYYDDNYYNDEDAYYQDEYYDNQYLTPVEAAYWSTMPSKYKKGGDVKILNTYYTNYYAPSTPRVNIAMGYRFGGYGPSWGFGITIGNPGYYYEPYWMWPYNYYAYSSPWNYWNYYDQWAWYGPWYRPSWSRPYWDNPWYWDDPYWWHNGYHPNRPGGGGNHRPPVQRPPHRYPSDTDLGKRPGSEGNYNPGGNQGGRPSGNDRPSDNRPPINSSISSEGYDRRPSGNSSSSSGSRPSTGSGQQSGARPSTGGDRGNPSSSTNGQRSGYENIRGGSSSSNRRGSSSSSENRVIYRAPGYESGSSSSGSSRRSYNNGSSSRSYSNPSSSSSDRSYDNSSSSRSYSSPNTSSSYSAPSSSYSSPGSSGSSSSSSSGGTSASGYSRR